MSMGPEGNKFGYAVVAQFLLTFTAELKGREVVGSSPSCPALASSGECRGGQSDSDRYWPMQRIRSIKLIESCSPAFIASVARTRTEEFNDS